MYNILVARSRPTVTTPPPLVSAATSPTFPSYVLSGNEKPTLLPRSQTTGLFTVCSRVEHPVCLVQSKTRAIAKCKGEKGGSKIFEHYQSTVTQRTQQPSKGNSLRRIRRTSSCGSLEMDSFKSNQVQEHGIRVLMRAHLCHIIIFTL